MIENLNVSVDTKNIYPKKAKPLTTHDKLRNQLKEIYQNDWEDSWLEDLPKKWKICEDLLILPPTCFTLPHWSNLEKKDFDLWERIASIFKVKRVAKENRVKSDDFRSPNLKLLYGDDPIVVINNNGIK